MTLKQPTLEVQSAHWGKWAEEDSAINRGEGIDAYCDQVIRLARECAGRCSERGRLNEVGCGTGWLSKSLVDTFDSIWACDLSDAGIRIAGERTPGVTFAAGDFLQIELPEPADMVFSMEAVAHVANQREFFRRCRQITKPGGRFLLVTQNPFTWSRTRWLEPLAEGRLRHWPTIKEIRDHYQAVGYEIVSLRTVQPDGDLGLLWWRPYAQGVIRRVFGARIAQRLFEGLRLGRSYVIEAHAV